jgi:hypothetical protein
MNERCGQPCEGKRIMPIEGFRKDFPQDYQQRGQKSGGKKKSGRMRGPVKVEDIPYPKQKTFSCKRKQCIGGISPDEDEDDNLLFIIQQPFEDFTPVIITGAQVLYLKCGAGQYARLRSGKEPGKDQKAQDQ